MFNHNQVMMKKGKKNKNPSASCRSDKDLTKTKLDRDILIQLFFCLVSSKNNSVELKIKFLINQSSVSSEILVIQGIVQIPIV